MSTEVELRLQVIEVDQEDRGAATPGPAHDIRQGHGPDQGGPTLGGVQGGAHHLEW